MIIFLKTRLYLDCAWQNFQICITYEFINIFGKIPTYKKQGTVLFTSVTLLRLVAITRSDSDDVFYITI